MVGLINVKVKIPAKMESNIPLFLTINVNLHSNIDYRL